ncbi:MAG TPA: hypothetical protein V6D00_03285 [Pantanalinema sp.]
MNHEQPRGRRAPGTRPLQWSEVAQDLAGPGSFVSEWYCGKCGRFNSSVARCAECDCLKGSLRDRDGDRP